MYWRRQMFYNPSQCLKNSFFDLKGIVKVRPPQGYKSTGPWLSGWSYRRPVTITEQSGSDLTNYQVLIELDATNFDFTKAQTNGEDIRFTIDDAETLIDHWIESWDGVGETAKVWVEVPSLASLADTTIYMYYGNGTALDASNGDATFEFFDDFETWNGWTQYGNGIVSQDNTRSFDGSYSAYKTSYNDPNGAYKSIGNTLGRNITLLFKVNRNSNYTGGSIDRVGVLNVDNNGYGWASDHYDDEIGIDKRVNYVGYQYSAVAVTDEMDAWNKGVLSINSTTIYAKKYLENGVFDGETSFDDIDFSGFDRVYIFGGYDYWVDQLLIRKYTSPEPIITIGSEETS